MDEETDVPAEAIPAGPFRDALRTVPPERVGRVTALTRDASYVEPRVVTQRV